MYVFVFPSPPPLALKQAVTPARLELASQLGRRNTLLGVNKKRF